MEIEFKLQDFRVVLLWLRAMEILVGHSDQLVRSELDMDLFLRWRSPYQA